MEVGNVPVDASYDELLQIIEYLKSTDKHNSAYLDELEELIKNRSKKENVYTKSINVSKINTLKVQPDKSFVEKENIQAKSVGGKNGTAVKTSKKFKRIIENKSITKRKPPNKTLFNNKRNLKPKQKSLGLVSKASNEKAKFIKTNDKQLHMPTDDTKKLELHADSENYLNENSKTAQKELEWDPKEINIVDQEDADKNAPKAQLSDENEIPCNKNVSQSSFCQKESPSEVQEHEEANIRDNRKAHSKKSLKLVSSKSENRETIFKRPLLNNKKVLPTKGKPPKVSKRTSDDLPFKCTECSYTTTLKRRFEGHIRTHKYKPFRCIYCDIDFPLEDTYNHHMESHYRKLGYTEYVQPSLEKEEEEEQESKDIFSNLADVITDDAELDDETDHTPPLKKIEGQHSSSENTNSIQECSSQNKEATILNTSNILKSEKVEVEKPPDMNNQLLIETKEAENETNEDAACETVLKCKDCSYTTTLKRRFEAHIQTHEYKQYKCIQCDEDFILEESYNQHLERHNKKYSCDLCAKGFSKEISLINHKISKHPETLAPPPVPPPTEEIPCKTVYTPTSIKIIKCPHCKYWTNAFQLESHLAKHGHISQSSQPENHHEKDLSHTQQIDQTSDNCKKLSSSSHCQPDTVNSEIVDKSKDSTNNKDQVMISPVDTFENITPNLEFQNSNSNYYNCKICNKAFAKSFLLKRHHFFHQGTKLKACNVCKYKCFSSSFFVLHKRTHLQEKPFKCPRRKCNHSFMLISQLRRHLRNHSSNLFKCAHCTFFSAHSKLISLHQKKMHQ